MELSRIQDKLAQVWDSLTFQISPYKRKGMPDHDPYDLGNRFIAHHGAYMEYLPEPDRNTADAMDEVE